MKPIDKLKLLKRENIKREFPNLPEFAYPKIEYKTGTANGLTKAVIEFLTLSGHQAERISTTGRPIDNTKKYTNVMGQTKVMGSVEWIPGTGRKGSADISSTIGVTIGGHKVGLSVKWEVKMKDQQSKDQKEYEQEVNNTGGRYYVIRDFDDFYEKYQELINFYS